VSLGLFGACLAALEKRAAMAIPQDILQSAERLRDLEHSAPTREQVLRGAAVGSVAGPAAGFLNRAISGKLSRGLVPNLREVAGGAATGVIFGGLMPAARHRLEYNAEKQRLQELVGHVPANRRGRVRRTLGI